MQTEAPHRHESTGLAVDFTAALGGFLLIVAGAFDLLKGLAAIAHDEVYAVVGTYLYKFDLTAWGWIHTVLGIVAVLVGIGVIVHRRWAQLTGIVVAAVSMVANFMSLPYYPVWSVVIIAIAGFVIWALSSQLSRRVV